MSRVTNIISGSRYIRRPNRPPSKDIIVGPMASYHRIFVGGRRDVADHQHDFRFTLYPAAEPAALQERLRWF